MDTIKKGVPKKIDNDGLVDSLVVLDFETDYNIKKLESELDKFLNENLTSNEFAKTPLRKKDLESFPNNANSTDVFYSNGELKVFIDDNKFIVNSLNKYPGWDVLGKFVHDIINVFFELVHFNHVGVRYISLMKNESFVENMDGSINFNHFRVFNGAEYNFSCAANEKDGLNDAKIVVHLTEKAKINDGLSSIIDVEATTDLKKYNPQNQDAVFSHVQYCHVVEKDVFFRLLSDKYISKHNPVW